MMQTKQSNYAGIFDNRIGFGDTPALIVIDFMKGYVAENSPLFAMGVIPALQESKELLRVARMKKIPVLHTVVRYNPITFAEGGLWIRKAPVLKCLVEGNPWAEICDEVRPAPEETVITKHYASAFFGTTLAGMLAIQRVDTVILIGCSTSGCIRASAVDALQHGFRPVVIRDCVGDRHPDVHEANLFDINSKYGDVVGKSEVINYLLSLPDR